MKNLFLGCISLLVLSGCVSTGPFQGETPVQGWGEANASIAKRLMRDMPAVEKEFRAVWVATVDNIDWPSRPGLSVSDQKSEMRDILDKARMMNLNAIVFQVRPAADALYASTLEPWSYYLTGENGEAPKPFYDPLAFAVEEAHRRGMELHAWFNPYRAYHPTAPDSLSGSHIRTKMPESVHTYGALQWMDPGSPQATEHSLAVIMDVVERYDIDGVHLDDYFYPYPVDDPEGNRVEFPDSAFYKIYGDGLSRSDWRRRNVDNLVSRIYSGIKERKPWVLFGISPFGIWRPNNPEGITGFDAYENLYADAKKWLNEGWVDYFTPQLYWAIDSSGQPYSELLDWWIKENGAGRHMWPGLFTSRIILEGNSHWEPEEIVAQVKQTRLAAGATGNIHFSMRALMPSDSKLSDDLSREVYSSSALSPATTWLGGAIPEQPHGSFQRLGTMKYLTMKPGGDTELRNWVVRIRQAGTWNTKIVPAWLHAFSLEGYENAEAIVLQSVTRLGQESEPLVLFPN